MSLRRTLWLSLTFILALALAACGGTPAAGGAGSDAAQPTAEPAASQPTAAPAEQAQPTGATTAAPAATKSAATAEPAATAEAADEAAPAPTAEETTATVSTGDGEDPEADTLAQANALGAGTTAASLMADDEDWFTISVAASGILTLTFTPDGAAEPMDAVLWDADGNEVHGEYGVGPGTTKTMSWIHNDAAGGDYAVSVLGGPGEYALDVAIGSQDDAGSGADAGSSPASALEIAAGEVITGMIGDLDTEDLYSLDVEAGTVLDVSFAAVDDDAGNLQIALLDSGQNEIRYEYDVVTHEKSFGIILGHENAGTYYVLVHGETGGYRFEVTAEPQNDAGSGKDAGDKPASAVSVELGKSYTGLIGDWDADDLFKFTAKDGDILDVTFTPADDAEATNVAVMDADMNELWSEYSIGPGSIKTFSQILDAEAGGTYYAAVFSGYGGYALNLSAEGQNDAGSGADAGDTPGSAVVVEPNASYSGQIGGSDEEDLFKFEVEEGAVIALSFASADDAEAMSVGLWDPDLNELWGEYGVGPGVTKTTNYVVGSGLEGTYYLWVGAPYGQDSYTFKIEVSSQDDAGSGSDAGDAPGQAVDVEPDVEFSGLLGNEDVEDYYRFEPEVGQVIIVTGGADAEGLAAAILDGDENPLWEEYEIGPEDTVEYEIEEIEGETPYYLEVWGDAGTYTAVIEPAP